MGLFKWIKPEDDICITTCILRYILLQMFVNIRYQTNMNNQFYVKYGLKSYLVRVTSIQKDVTSGGYLWPWFNHSS